MSASGSLGDDDVAVALDAVQGFAGIGRVAEVGARAAGLADKRVLVTGGASGIGAATSARFLEEGASVCVLDRDPDARARIRKELPGLSGVLEADVSDRDSVEAAFASAVETMGAVDVLINNAGQFSGAPFTEMSVADFDRLIATEALVRGVPVLTRDSAIRDAGLVAVVWD